MPGPRNSKKQKRQQAEKDKARLRKALKEVHQNTSHSSSNEDGVCIGPNASSVKSKDRQTEDTQNVLDAHLSYNLPNTENNSPSNPAAFHEPVILNLGNGPRVKNIEAFLSSYFCPPVSSEDGDCMKFAREEIVTVLEAILPREIALIVWYNRTRKFERICPACQRLFRLGDSLFDPVSGELIDMNNPRTPPHVLREQQLSGFCSFPCLFLASFSSHPYSTEVASGVWGLPADELDPHVLSLLDATDPSTAAILRYGLAAFTPSQSEDPSRSPNDQGLGRVLRLTRRKDLGLGEVLEALVWYEKEGKNGQIGLR